MNDFIKLSHQRKAVIKMAVCLWNQADVNSLMARIHFSQPAGDRPEKWQYIENEVTGKVRNLPLLENQKLEIFDVLKPIGLQIYKWLIYHIEECIFGMKLPKNLLWTDHGTVDKRQTAKLWIRSGHLDIIKSYKLACMYCIEDDIRILFNQIPDCYLKILRRKKDPLHATQEDLVDVWTCYLRGELDTLDFVSEENLERYTPYEYAFISSVLLGNEVSTEYYLQKLTLEERNKYLVSCAVAAADQWYKVPEDSLNDICDCYSDVLRFLVSQMNEEEEEKLLKDWPYATLSRFLHWPWQDCFLKMAMRCVSYLHEDIFNSLLRNIIENLIDGYYDYDYKFVFREYWKHSTSVHKRYAIQMCTSPGSLVYSLFIIADEESISLIFKEATPTEKEAIIFSFEGRDICEMLVYAENWDSLEFFIHNCISSREKMIIFKNEFLNYMFTRSGNGENEEIQPILSRFLNDLVSNME